MIAFSLLAAAVGPTLVSAAPQAAPRLGGTDAVAHPRNTEVERFARIPRGLFGMADSTPTDDYDYSSSDDFSDARGVPVSDVYSKLFGGLSGAGKDDIEDTPGAAQAQAAAQQEDKGVKKLAADPPKADAADLKTQQDQLTSKQPAKDLQVDQDKLAAKQPAQDLQADQDKLAAKQPAEDLAKQPEEDLANHQSELAAKQPEENIEAQGSNLAAKKPMMAAANTAPVENVATAPRQPKATAYNQIPNTDEDENDSPAKNMAYNQIPKDDQN